MLMLFLTVALVHIVALLTPGPDFFFVSQTAISRSRKEAMLAVAGITLGVMVWAGIALLGLHLILEKMAWLHNIIMVGGGLYLCWMGYQMIRSALRKESTTHESQPTLVKSGQSFFKGLLTNLANPKAIIYFGSVFSLFVGDNVGGSERVGIFVLIAVETLAWFTLVACLFSLPKMRRGYQRMARWIDGMAGTLFTAFGLHLIISR